MARQPYLEVAGIEEIQELIMTSPECRRSDRKCDGHDERPTQKTSGQGRALSLFL